MFIDELLLDKVAFGFVSGREWNTRIKTQRSGREKRNSNWNRPKHRYSAPYQNLKPELHTIIVDAFNTALGRGHSFRFFDRLDYKLEDQVIGTAEGSSDETMQLVKTYGWGTQQATRPIECPIDADRDYGRLTNILGAPPAWVVKADDVAMAESDWDLDYVTGLLALSAAQGAVITVSGWFDVPVRFDSDELRLSVGNRAPDGYVGSATIDLMEVWDETTEADES